MKHQIEKMRTVLSFFLFVLLPLGITANPTLEDLDISVELLDNGDIHVTEVRQMTIDHVGSECYIVMGYMNGREVYDLEVSDETGLKYENIGAWDIDASRSRKAGKCGIVTKSNGYELCWGLGDEGSRTYTVSYYISKVVRAYDDADGFNFMFVAQDINPAPRHARIVFTLEDRKEISQNDVKMWGFRYNGTIDWHDGRVVAETVGGLSGSEAMIVMLRFEKGVLHPEEVESGSFEAVKERAFEGSDYASSDSSFADGMDMETIFWLFIIAAIIILSPFVIGGYLVWKWMNRHEAKQNLLWYRGLPYNGNLKKTYEVLNAYSWVSYSNKNLISALVVKLISIGALAIEEHWIEPTGLRKLTGKGPQLKKLIAIKELRVDENTPDRFLLKRLWSMFAEAAGSDDLLQPNELRTWMRRNEGSVEALLTNLKPTRGLRACSKDLKNVREVFGMELFLKDFTLANERHATEVRLWKDYLVFAELFGIAKQVRKDMMQANAEYLQMDDVCRQLNDNDVLPAITIAALSGIGDVQRAQSSSRSSGGGGWSSFGGGGGFSGGGSGGGVR